jgi:hypothetical protein
MHLRFVKKFLIVLTDTKKLPIPQGKTARIWRMAKLSGMWACY